MDRTHLIILCTLLLGACTTPGRRTPVDVARAPAVASRVEIGREVGWLLSADEQASRAAERRLVNLTGEARDELLSYRERIPTERDPRWLNVLDEHHALPELDDQAHIDFLLWKGARDSRFYAMKAQSRLLDMARTKPDVLIARLAGGGPGMDAIAVALAQANVLEAVPVLLDIYTGRRTDFERRAAAEALTMLAGESRRPRARGTTREYVQDAEVIRAWYREQQALAAEREGARDGGPIDG
ncbi:MAG: hypothetical protein QNJ98_05145 [Planctomycetota bacterium]|nr:hypothetical protein [Planctomycetota bacterium]